jgi:hypothetical protein
MAEIVPQIKVTDPSATATSRRSFQKQDNGASITVEGTSHINTLSIIPNEKTSEVRMLTPRPIGPPLSNKKLAAKLRSPTTPSAPPSSDTQYGNVDDGRRLSETPIDPLSQQILHRTNTSPAVQKLRSQNTEPGLGQSQRENNEANADKKLSGETPRDGSGGNKSEKK